MQDGKVSTAGDCARAIQLAEQVLSAGGNQVSRYTLVFAQYTTATTREFVSAMSWHLAFKRRDLLPAGPYEPIGAGGEIFVEVDLHEGRAVITGHGA